MEQVLHLGYHYVRDGNAPGPNCSPARLRAHIRALLEQGYELLTCGEVAERVRQEKPLPGKHATISFDDGLKDQYTAAFPILEEFGVPATFFYITCALDGKLPPVIGFQIAIDKLGPDRLREEILPSLFNEYGLFSYQRLLESGKFDYSGMKMGEPENMRLIKAVFNHFVPPSLQAELIAKIFARHIPGAEAEIVREWFMSAEELVKMSAAGMEIASHSVRHPWLSMIGESEIEAETRASCVKIAEITGRDAATFAWTFGASVPRREAQAAVRRSGCLSAWNFWSAGWAIERLQENTYGNLMDVPRLHEQVFLPDAR